MLYLDYCKTKIGLLFSFTLLITSGCATIDPDFMDPRDPYEVFNRSVHTFNEAVDNVILKPVSEGYEAITPEPVDQGITNFFKNLEDVNSILNNLLQLKPHAAMEDTSRVLVNTTFGIGGIFDIATDLEIPRHNEDFGQTLGYWGIGPGPYLVLPLLGPSSQRDALGQAVDAITDPLNEMPLSSETKITLRTLNIIDTRADLLDASRILQDASLGDTYTFLRDSYLQRRLQAVHDGNVPEDEMESF